MTDRCGREINYLRISVTDRCNLRCTYCMPAEGIALTDHSKILTFSQITDFASVAVAKGIKKIRLTGGEPLVRKEIIKLTSMLSAIPGLTELTMTTNGTLLHIFAKELKDAGLKRVNISLDTTDPVKFREITRGGDIETVFRGIDAAVEAGLTPVKINCVVEKSKNEPDALGVLQYAHNKEIQVRFIPRMDLEKGEFGVVEGGDGGNCQSCNRLRLTSTGQLRPCLFSDIQIDVIKYGAQQALEMALASKPDKGNCTNNGNFYNIGG